MISQPPGSTRPDPLFPSTTLFRSRQVEDDRQRVEERRGRAAAALAATIVSDAVDALTSAVDHARALGADADARCDALRVTLDGAKRRAEAALARLTPWPGDGHALPCLPRVDDRGVHAERQAPVSARPSF